MKTVHITSPTENYEVFKHIGSNRTIVDNHVKKLMSSIGAHNLLEANPIIVDKHFNVVDGQHRLEACKRLNIPVYWVQPKNIKNIKDSLISLNSNQKSWTLADYVQYYALEGKEEYCKIMELIERGFNMSNALAIAGQGNAGRSIKIGTFKCGAINHHSMANIVEDYQSIIDEVVNTKVIRALSMMFKTGLYDHKTHFKSLKKNKYDLEKCATPEQYIKMFQKIINKNQRKEKRIYFI